jgi:phosphoribosylformylglycinamidine synthase
MTYEAVVTVTLKAGVHDPEAATIERSLERLGFDVADLRTADEYVLDVDAESADAARGAVEEMCERLLANPVIHDYEIAIRDGETGGDAGDAVADGGEPGDGTVTDGGVDGDAPPAGDDADAGEGS